jgi:3-dehydroquinate synthase
MADASIGGKTGFDLFGVKNFAGSFYPAQKVFMPLESLSTLAEKEWKSGMAEIIKTAVLDGDEDSILSLQLMDINSSLQTRVEKAVRYKGAIVTEDPRESGRRMLLNLGHTFGHALEAAAGLGKITHGEAVAWGILQSCALGVELGITPRARAQKIKKLISSFGYDCRCPHPLSSSPAFNDALANDKKKKNKQLTFIVPDEKSARAVVSGSEEMNIVRKIIKEGYDF